MVNRHVKASLWVLWLVAFAVGAIGLAQRFLYGHALTGYGNYVPWGLWVAVYFHGVGIAGGLYLFGAVRFLFFDHDDGARHRLRRTLLLSVISIAMGLAAIGLDLGRMERAYRIFTSPNFLSMMTFNSWMYAAFTLLAITALILSYNRKSGWFKPLLLVGLPLAMAIPSQSGAFFGVVDAKPFWSSALFPFLFLVSAVAAGSGLLLAVEQFLDEPDRAGPRETARVNLNRWVVLGAILLYFMLEWAEVSISLLGHSAEHREAWGLILHGQFWWVFWIVHLLLGGLVPFGLLISARHNRLAQGLAGLLVAVGFISARLNILIPGQTLEQLRGLQQAFFHPRLTYAYVATAHEYMVTLFLVAAGTGIFYVGLRLLPQLSPNSTTGGRK